MATDNSNDDDLKVTMIFRPMMQFRSGRAVM